MQHSLHRRILILVLMIMIMIMIIILLLIIIMINCVMRALSSGLSEGWSRSRAPTRIAGTLPKMQSLRCSGLCFCIFVFLHFCILYCVCNGLDYVVAYWGHSRKSKDCAALGYIYIFLHFCAYVVFSLLWSGHCPDHSSGQCSRILETFQKGNHCSVLHFA